MSGTSKIIAVIASCSIILFAASVSTAGVLYNNPNAFDDNLGLGPGGSWTGQLHFDVWDDPGHTQNLKGFIDYAVFTAGVFNAQFPGLGYVPGDSLVYTYQVFNTGNVNISGEIVGVANAANTIGSFNIGDVAPSSAVFVGTNARWLFGIPSGSPIAPGQSSYGLAFSSPNVPIIGAGVTIDSGLSALVVGLPTPGAVPIPEPTALLLICLGGGVFMFLRRQ